MRSPFRPDRRIGRVARRNRNAVTKALTAVGSFGVLAALLAAVLWPGSTSLAAAGINHEINFQGKVVNTDGTNVTNGSYNFVFKIYNVSSGGSSLWTESKSLTVTDGVFQTNLGDTTTLPGSIDFNTDSIYLGINFNSDGEMTPRIRFTASPYAFNSEELGGLTAAQFAQLSPGSAQSGFLNVTGNITSGATVAATTSLQAPLVDTASAVTLNIGTGTASAVTIGRTTTPFTIQGSSASTFTATSGGNTTTVSFTAPTGTRAINFPDAGGTLCTTTASTCSATYQVASATGYLAKNTTDTSSFAVTAANYLYGFTNSSSGVASGVLKLDNGSNTGDGLLVTASGNAGAGNALLVVNGTNGTPSGNLLDLQISAASKFSVDTSGNLTQTGGTTTTDTINGQRISSAANFTGTVTAATSLLAPLLDTASAGVLAVGTNNATAINLNQNTVVANNKSFTAGGSALFQDATNSATAFQVQNTDTENILAADTTASTNVLADPEFALGSGTTLTDWTKLSTPTTWQQNTTAANTYDGQTSLQMVTTTSVGQGIQSTVFNPATPFTSNGGTYTFSIYIMQTGGTALNGNNFEALALGGGSPTSAPCTINGSGTTTLGAGFQQVSCLLTFTSTSGINTIKFRTRGTISNAATLWMSDAQLQTGSVATPIQLGGLQLKGIVTNAVNLQSVSNSTTAFQVQNTANATELTVDTLGNRVVLGSINGATALQGALAFSDGTTDGFTGTVQLGGAIGSNQTYTLPTTGGTFCLTTQNCSVAGSGYILNQSSSPGSVQTGNFNISGTGIAATLQGSTSVLTPLLDTASSGVLAVGTTNATAINLNQNTVVASNKSLTANGSALFEDATNSTTALQIQNASAATLVNVDTSTTLNQLPENASNFETGQGWSTLGSGVTLTQDTAGTTAYSGTHTLKIVTTTTGPTGAQYPESFTSASVYSFSVDARITSGSMGTFVLGYHDTADHDCSASGLSTTGWNRIICSFTASATASGYLYIKDTGNGNTFYVDAAQFELGGSATPYNGGGQLQFNGLITSPLSIRNPVNSNTALLLENAPGSAAGALYVLQVDTQNGKVGIDIGANGAPSTDLAFGSGANRTIAINTDNGGAGRSLTLQGGNATGGANAGGGVIVQGGTTTGSGAGGNITLTPGNSSGGGAAGTVIAKPLASSDSTTFFQVQNAAGNAVLTVDTSSNSSQGLVGLGKASTNTGSLVFYNSGASGSTTLNANSPGSSTFTVSLPAETGTLCTNLSTGTCTTAGSGFIFNQSATPGSAQTGNFNISGTGIANILQAANSVVVPLVQTADSNSADTAALTVRTGNESAGSAHTSGALSLKSGDGSGTNSSSGAVTLDAGTATGSGTVGAVNVGTGNATQINVGRTAATFTIQGTNSSTIKATSGANTTTVGFIAPTAARAINFPDEGGTLCIQNSANCGFVVGSSASFIQNQIAAQQATSNFWISGTGRADTNFISPLVQTADSNSADTTALVVRSGTESAGSAHTSGTVTIQSGNGTGTNSSSGNVAIDSGTHTGGGFSGNLTLGGTNALNVQVGRNGTSAAADATLLLEGTASTSKIIMSDSTDAHELQIGFTTPTAARTVTFGDAGGLVCLDSGNCDGTTGVGYILNQTGSNQTANFQITGTGRANTSILTPLLDTPSGTTTLNIGTTNATAGINLNQNVTVASGKSVTIQGNTTQSGGTFSLTGNNTSQISTTTGALTVTSAAAATWSTAAGDLSIYGTGNLNLGNTSSATINVGSTGAHTVNVGTDNSNAEAVNVGSTNSASTISLKAGNLTESIVNSGVTITTANTTTALLVQNAGSANVLQVDTSGLTNLIKNPGGENAVGAGNWQTTGFGSNVTVSRDTTTAWTGLAAVKALITPHTGNAGAQNNLGAALTISTQYTLSFYAKMRTGDPAFTDITAKYLRDGTTTDATCASFNTQTVVTTGWTRITCTFTTSSTAGNTSAAIAIYQVADPGAGRAFWLDGVLLEPTANIADASGAGRLRFDGVVTSPLLEQNSEDSTTSFSVQNAAGTTQLNVDTLNSIVSVANQLNVGGTLQVNTITPTGSMTIGATGQQLTLQGNASTTLTATGGGQTTTLGFLGSPTASVTYYLDRTTTGGPYLICTEASTSCDGSNGYLRKGVEETDNVSVTTSGHSLLTLNNGGSGSTSTLTINNGSGLNSALSVTSAASINASNAVIFGSDTLNNATGSLLDLWSTQSATAASRFAVDMTGNLVQSGNTTTTDTINGQRISSAANFTGTVTEAGALTVSAGGAGITGNSSVTGTLGVTSTLSATGSGAAEVIASGTPLQSGTTGLVEIGNVAGLGGMNNVANGGTYIALNVPSSGAGSAADMLNFENNGSSKILIDKSGNIVTAANQTYNSDQITSTQFLFGGAGANSIQAAGGQGLTITGNGASGFTTTAGSNSFDANTTAGLGTSTATAVSIGKSTTTATINGTAAVGASAGSGALLNNGSTTETVDTLSNCASNCTLSQTAVDNYTYLALPQTTASITVTVPAPSAATTYGKVLYVTNTGTNALTLLSTNLSPGSSATLVWANVNSVGTWTYAGADAGGLQSAYNNSATTDPQIQLSNTNGGIKIRDAASSTITNLLQISDSTNGTKYLTVTSATSGTLGTANIQLFASGLGGSTRTISVADQASAGQTGDSLTVKAAAGNTTGIGGTLTLNGGAGGNNAQGGQVSINGGAAGGGNNNGGAVTITGGTAAGTGTGGTMSIQGGAASATAGSAGGALQVLAAAGAASASATTAGNGGALSITSGAGGANSSTGAGGNGADVTITAGNGGNSGGSAANSNGGSIRFTAGNAGTGGSGTAGVPGVISIDTPVFTATTETASGASYALTQSNVDNFSTIVVTESTPNGIVTVPAPRNLTTGRILYVTAAGTNSFTLNPSTAVNMAPGNTAMLVWNNAVSQWTAMASASSLQQAYNNTSSTPASIVTTSSTKNVLIQAGSGFDNANLFQIGNSLGAQTLTVDTTNTASSTNLGDNTGAESGTTGWAAYQPSAGQPTISQDTSAGNFASGTAAIKVHFTASQAGGVQNDLNAAALATTATTYNVSFSVKFGTSTPTLANFIVEYYRNSTPTLDATCTTPASTAVTLSTSAFVKYTCSFTSSGNAKATTNFIRIRQADSATRDWWIDNFALISQNTTATQNTSDLQVGGPNGQGLTLLTLDSYASTPWTGTGTNLLGSMYYDTSVGLIKCYQASGWGTCGAAPNNNVTLVPEYAGAVLNGSGTSNTGTMTANLCANTGTLSGGSAIQPDASLCGSGDLYEFYKWTTSQATAQTFDIYVRSQLPPTFKSFSSSPTVVARVSSTTDGVVTASMYAKDTTGVTDGTLCGTAVTTSSANTWQTLTLNTASCSFNASDWLLFKIDVSAKNNAFVYASNISWVMTGK